MKLFVLLALLAAAPALAHEGSAPEPLDPDMTLVMNYCAVDAAHQAWGALSRYAGAPLTFKYVSEDVLRPMFWSEKLPSDAIYLLDGMDLTQRKDYEEAALAGWKQADRWAADNVKNPGYSVLLAVFYGGCREHLIPKAAAKD